MESLISAKNNVYIKSAIPPKRSYQGDVTDMKYFYRYMFNRCTFIDRNENLSTNFMDLCAKQKTLTFNIHYLRPGYFPRLGTPFLEIQRYDNFFPYNPSSIDDVLEFDSNPAEKYLHNIIEAIKIPLRKLSGHKVFFSCSAGSDSRIIMGTMAQLRDEGCNFDNIVFGCWGRPEAESFYALMKRFGWTNIYMLDDTGPNPYKIGNSYPPVDGFYPYTSQMRYWGELPPSEYILLSGAAGCTFFRKFEDFVHSEGYFCERGEAEHRMARIFKDVCFPYLYPDVLHAVMSIPTCLKNIPDPRLNRDKLRTDLCQRLGALDGIPMLPSYYNINFTNELKEQMLELYYSGRFFHDFHAAMDKDKLFEDHVGFFSRLWAFAVTVYDNLMK